MVKAKRATTGIDSGIAVPVATSEDKHPRMLIIEFIGDAPKMVFKGDWTVRHLLTIKRCISREFKFYRRSVLRANVANITNKEIAI